MSEAALHRLTMSSSVPPNRPPSSAPPSSGPATDVRHARPVGNRFPEQIDDEDEGVASESSADDKDEMVEAESDWGVVSIGGYGTDDEDEKRSALWRTFRGSHGSTLATLTTKSPGSDRARSEADVSDPDYARVY